MSIYNSFCSIFCSKYRCDKGEPIRIYLSDTVKRSYCDDSTIVIQCKKAINFFLDTEEEYFIDVDVLIHELAHVIEDCNSDIQMSCQKFLRDRTQNEQPILLNDLWMNNPQTTLEEKNKYPNGPYENDEIAKPDNFFDSYCGKIYSDGKTEILTMGLERLMQDPLKFKKRRPRIFLFYYKTNKR